MLRARRQFAAVHAATTVVLAWGAGLARGAEGSGAAAAATSAWATGGTSATAKPTDPDGKPSAGGTAGDSATIPFWQAPAVPAAVIQGGAIPPGWQPQAVPYQGIGPDGRPVTMYVAPTYVFTYPVGPPVPAVPQIDRRRGRGIMRPGVPTDPYGTGWNYRATGAAAVAPTLPPATVARYAPQPYRFPADSRALTGTPLVPPATALAGASSQPWRDAPAVATTPAAAPSPAAAGWTAANLAPTPGPPPAGWTAAAVDAVPPPPPIVAGAVAAPALASLPPPVAPIPSVAPATPRPIPVTTASLPDSSASADSNVHTWKVVAVYDGDTVTCLDGNNQQQRVRLAGIDAPEAGADFGKASRDALTDMVFGRTVQVVDDGRDGAGRVLGRLSVDGIDVNRRMIATGMAWNDPDSQDATFAAAEALARAGKLGIWSQPGSGPPADSGNQAAPKTT